MGRRIQHTNLRNKIIINTQHNILNVKIRSLKIQVTKIKNKNKIFHSQLLEYFAAAIMQNTAQEFMCLVFSLSFLNTTKVSLIW